MRKSPAQESASAPAEDVAAAGPPAVGAVFDAPDAPGTLERRVREFRGGTFADPIRRAEELAALEREVLERTARSQPLDARDAGDSVLSDVHDYRKLCQRLSLHEPVAAADELAGAFLADVARAWEHSVQRVLAAPTADACVQALLQTTTLRLEALAHGAASAAAEILERVQAALRERLEDVVVGERPSMEQRELWTTELVDRADLVLTSIDDQHPDVAADQLNLIARDLRWHLARVETTSRRLRFRLKRKLARLRAERQERRLQSRLERRFGARFVARSERLVLFLICLVLVLIVVELTVRLPATAYLWLHVVDGAACAVFLSEFFVRLAMVPGRFAWLRRHFLIDFIPSIPFGLLTLGTPAATWGFWADVVRFLRAARIIRFTRLLRVLGLLARGFDRLARQYGHVLNQNIILYPTRAELQRARAALDTEQSSLRRLRLELRHDWKRLLTAAPEPLRPQIARMRLCGLEAALEQTRTAGDAESVMPSRTREIPLSVLIERLQGMTPHDAEAGLGEDLVTQLAGATRLLARWPLRWLPILSSLVPKVTAEMTDAEVVAKAARRLAAVLKRLHDVWFWFSDLYGTVTPSQFVDRVGTMLVRGSSRPAYRLFLFGGLLVLTDALLSLAGLLLAFSTMFLGLREFLMRFLGTTVLVMGSISVVVLGIGVWLKRVAREATEFYERSAQAQFLALTEMIRSRSLQRDAEILYDRVLRPEWLARAQTGPDDGMADPAQLRARHLATLGERIEDTLLRAYAPEDEQHSFQGLESTLLLYRDWLDGALLADTDTRTTSQLLGNPGVRQFLGLSCRVGRKQIKALQVLDLERQKSLLGGPYLWFNLVARSITHSVACLLVDYNQNAIPLSELSLVGDAERERYAEWLAGEHLLPPATEKGAEKAAEERYVTTAFTALHFLDFDPQRDQQAQRRFGPDVLKKLQADRALLIRRIFGTYPMHDRPKEQRVVNLYTLYNGWLGGGRAYLIPLFVLMAGLRFLVHFVHWLRRSVREIRQPELRMKSRDAAKAHFLTAVRKIDRIRSPVVYASLRLRMQLDAEYLGVPLPGQSMSPLVGADVDADLRFVRPEPQFLEEVEHERRRAAADMRRLGTLLGEGLLERLAGRLGLPPDALQTEAHVRTAATAYLADLCGIRQHLSAAEILSEVYALAATEPPLGGSSRPRPKLKRMFRRYSRRHGFGGQRECRAAWRATLHNVWGAADALCVWDRQGAAAREIGEDRLARLLRHPGRITEQLLALRTIQTLAVLDVLNYRQHVYHLGRYADMGDTAGQLLEWRTTRHRDGAIVSSPAASEQPGMSSLSE